MRVCSKQTTDDNPSRASASEPVDWSPETAGIRGKIQIAKARRFCSRCHRKLAPREAATQAQLAALQARIESMHAAKLLSDDELCALEDLLADYFGLLACVEMVTMEMTSTSETADKVRKLVVLSEQMASDRPFARQCKRRFV